MTDDDGAPTANLKIRSDPDERIRALQSQLTRERESADQTALNLHLLKQERSREMWPTLHRHPTRADLDRVASTLVDGDEILATLLSGTCAASKASGTGCGHCIRRHAAHRTLKAHLATYPLVIDSQDSQKEQP